VFAEGGGMSDSPHTRSIWHIAGKSLLWSGVMCFAAAGVAGGANWLAQKIALEQGNAQATLDAANLSLENTQSDRARLEENLQMFDKLGQSRFAQQPDRLIMLEALERAASGIQRSALSWELGIQEKLKPLNDDKTAETVAFLVRVPMKLAVGGVHEEEWLSLLGRLQSAGAGYFRTDTCSYIRKDLSVGGASVPALDIECSLSWLYVVAEKGVLKAP
jgi:hypothetical protein